MKNKITKSTQTPIGKSYSNMIADIDNATISISTSVTEGVKLYIFKAKIKVYVDQASLGNGSGEVMTETVMFSTTNSVDVAKNPYLIIETELGKKYTLA